MTMTLKRSSIAKFSLFAYFLLSPIYVFSSGLPQPSDYVAAIFLFPWVLFSLSRLPKFLKCIFKPYSWFVAWAFIVNLVYAFFLDAPDMLVRSAFYAFGMLFCLGVAILSGLCKPENFFRLMQQLFALASFSALFFFIATWNLTVFRHTGSFNNPNQAAYFGLLITCLSIISAWGSGQWGILLLSSVISSSLLVILAYSGGALASQFLAITGLSILLWTSKKVRLKVKYAIVFLVLLIYISIPVAMTSDSPVINSVLHNWDRRSARLESKAENIYEARGYERITGYPEYLLLGSGEGQQWRFLERTSLSRTYEIHSTFGAILFGYGIVGLTFVGLFMFRAMYSAPLGIWIVVASPMVYGISHQGARQPLFWLIFVLVAIAAYTDKVRQAYNFNYSSAKSPLK